MHLRLPRNAALLLAIAYAVFGAVWILVSDNILAALVEAPRAMTIAQTWKGWFFVAASAVLIVVTGRPLLRRLDQSEQRYRLLFADSPVPMLLYDPQDGMVVEVNPALCRLISLSPAELTGRPAPTLLSDEDQAHGRMLVERARATAEPFVSVHTVRCGDGRHIQAEIRGETVRFGPRPLRLLVFSDVTARRHLEEALIGALDTLRQQEAQRAQLAHALAHDLREPIRQVASFVQLLSRRHRGDLSPDADQWIEFASEGAHRLHHLLSDLEAFTAPPVPQTEHVATEAVLAEVLETEANAIDAAGARLCVGEMPDVETDRRTLTVVFTALIDNAVKFRRPDRPCRILAECERLDREWCFSIRDSGPGIEREYAETVFTLFARLQPRGRKITGNGTGLALARKLIEAAGGRIWVDPDIMDGTRVCFTIPAPAVAPQH